jgi:hypothetical protein
VDTDRLVLNCAIVTFGSTVATSVAPAKWGGRGEFPPPRLLLGAGLSFFGLSILADLAPGIAGPLSAAMALTALTYYGIPVLDAAFNGTKPTNTRNGSDRDTTARQGSEYAGGPLPAPPSPTYPTPYMEE